MGILKGIGSWVKEASRNNRVFRTFIQAFMAYLTINLPTFWDGGGDLIVAVEALLLGALASGLSAIWKPTQDQAS